VRVRSAKFAIVPTWVAFHRTIVRNPTRLAVYVGLRIVAYEHESTEWRSDRELAAAIGEIIGLGSEAVRKHLRQLRQQEIVGGDSGEIVIVNDEPGYAAGYHATHPGYESAHQTSLLESTEISKRDLSAAPVAVPDADPLDALFDGFWKAYPKPRRVGKPTARAKFKAALKKATGREIADGLRKWVCYWEARNEPQFIPHPSTWLNQERWNDEPPPLEVVRKTSPGMAAVRALGVSAKEIIDVE
jgi:hypothetical protein